MAKKTVGPLISSDGMKHAEMLSGVSFVEEPINETLKIIGIYKHEGKDEFDSVRLGYYRTRN